MKKFYSIIAVVAMATVANAQTQSMNAFNGADFEDWTAFKSSLNRYSVKYAQQGIGTGYDASNSIHINETVPKNDFVFTTVASENLPKKINSISFWIKGVSSKKGLSINFYHTKPKVNKNDLTYYSFNLGNLQQDSTFSPSDKNDYAGKIDTNGEWVKVTLDTSSITDFQQEAGKDFFALKVGKDGIYDLHIDNIVINYDSTLSLTNFTKEKPVFVKNTLVNDNTLSFANGGEVKIFNQNGQMVKSAKVEANSTLDISSLSTGVYIVVGVVNGEKISQKIIKK